MEINPSTLFGCPNTLTILLPLRMAETSSGGIETTRCQSASNINMAIIPQSDQLHAQKAADQ